MFRYRDKALAERIIREIKDFDRHFTFMHVCGTHQDTLVRHGLDSLFKEANVEIRQGPGCPVCVTTQKEIEEAMALAKAGKTVVSYGDMMRVPGNTGTLNDIKSKGGDVRIVYSAEDAVAIARKTGKDTVFLGVGFETTAPGTAAILLDNPPENLSVLSFHRFTPPALKAIIDMGEVKLDGLIEPGHVSTIVGVKAWEFLTKDYGISQVVAGFEPIDLLMATYMLARQVVRGEPKIENEYSRLVKYEGNIRAQSALREVFRTVDVSWRGFPTLPDSGMELKKEFDGHNARLLFEDVLEPVWKTEFRDPPGCRCGDVLRGVIDSTECPLFGKACIPSNPIGPCMVSTEGSCNIMYRYGRKGVGP